MQVFFYITNPERLYYSSMKKTVILKTNNPYDKIKMNLFRRKDKV